MEIRSMSVTNEIHPRKDISEITEITQQVIDLLLRNDVDALEQAQSHMAERANRISGFESYQHQLSDQKKDELSDDFGTMMRKNEEMLRLLEQRQREHVKKAQGAKEDLKAHRSYHKQNPADKSLYIKKGLEG